MFNSFSNALISFKPFPVIDKHIWEFFSTSFSSIAFLNPAYEADPAGSANTPVFLASSNPALIISSSSTAIKKPPDFLTYLQAFITSRGVPTQILSAVVSAYISKGLNGSPFSNAFFTEFDFAAWMPIILGMLLIRPNWKKS